MWTVGLSARAYDQRVSSDLWAEGYTVEGPDGTTIRRRRIVENLRLSAWNLIPGSADPYYRGPRASFALDLRLDTDWAVGKAESNSADVEAYVPGLTPMQIDALVVQLDVTGLWQGVLDVTLGRQIRIDNLGFFAFDGLETRFRFPAHIGLSTYIGYEVRGGDLLGHDALELDGTDSGGRRDMQTDRYPGRTDPNARLAFGTVLRFTPQHWFEVGVGYRTVGLSEPLADERLGGQLRVGSEPVWLTSRAVYSPLLQTLTELDAEIAALPFEALSMSIEYHYFRPVFEGDSIFNVFDLAPEDDLGARVEVRLSDAISAAVWGFGRFSQDTAGISGEDEDAAALGVVGGMGANYAHGRRMASVRFSAEQEWGEHRLGTEMSAGHAFMHAERLWVNVRFSYWDIEDALAENLAGQMAGYVVSTDFRIAEGAELLGEFEQYFKAGRDPRYYAMVLLRLDLWR